MLLVSKCLMRRYKAAAFNFRVPIVYRIYRAATRLVRRTTDEHIPSAATKNFIAILWRVS